MWATGHADVIFLAVNVTIKQPFRARLFGGDISIRPKYVFFSSNISNPNNLWGGKHYGTDHWNAVLRRVTFCNIDTIDKANDIYDCWITSHPEFPWRAPPAAAEEDVLADLRERFAWHEGGHQEAQSPGSADPFGPNGENPYPWGYPFQPRPEDDAMNVLLH